MVISMERWKGKVAIVTGASSGIGAAIARALAEHGLIVAGLARRVEKVCELNSSLSSNVKIHPVKSDISKEESILEAFKWIDKNLGPVHILINNAGVVKNTNLCEGDTQMWKEIIETNLLGLSIATREAIKIMKKHNIEGHIIHMNSIMGHSVPSMLAGMNMYGPTKYAVTCLTETLRQELVSQDSRIKVSSISPGAVDTEIIQAAKIPKNPQLDMVFPKDNQILSPEDIADAVVYVLSTPPHVQVHELTIKPVGEKV